MTGHPPPHPPAMAASMSRSRATRDEVRATAEAMLRASLAHRISSTSATTTTSSEGIVTPPDTPRAEHAEPAFPIPITSFVPDVAMAAEMQAAAGRARLAAAIHLPGASSSATSTRTRERLRQAEMERDELRAAAEGERAKAAEMRRIAEEERALVERLKREGAFGPSATEAELRLLRLKYEALMAGTTQPPRATAGLFKSVCATDLLFLMDTTSSMSSYIGAAKMQVKSIVDDIHLAFFNEAEVRIAVVGYKDHNDTPNIQFLDFTTDVEKVRSFIDGLRATGGADTPEDVLGGMRQALNATWKHKTRCIVHIADAPPHGRTLHDLGDSSDDYPEPGSEPHHLTHEPLVKQMMTLNINYALLRINGYTDRMAWTFFQAYAAASPNCKLHPTNKYHSESTTRARSRTATAKRAGGLQFEEVELGTTYSALRHLVVKSVTTSASRTAGRLSAGGPRGLLEAGKMDTALLTIKEDEDAEEDDSDRFDTDPPQWDSPGWLDETIKVEAFSTDVVGGTLDDMMAHDDNFQMSTTELTIHKRSKPFAQGAMRVAAYARTAASTNRLVVKSYKKGGRRLAELAEDMRCQALCKAFALEFNALLGEEHSIDFIVVTCMKPKLGRISDSVSRASDECMSLEPYIDGEYVKYNSNCGYVNEDNPDDPFNHAAQAFSHFTYERSRGCFLISDLQGVGHVLTDPAIHTLDPNRFKLADTNLGEEGFKFFFATHECNDVCRKLGLKTNASMFLTGEFTYRENWPGMFEDREVRLGSAAPSESTVTLTVPTNMMVCCSNKLCSRIVSVATAHKSADYPGYFWCDGCWPQLETSTVSLLCVAPRTVHHEFNVSRFFYESQGQIMPRKCALHRASADFVARTAAMGLRLASGGDESEASGSGLAPLRAMRTGGVNIFGGMRG